MKKLFIIFGASCLFAACKPSVNVSIPPTAGWADFSNYLAIGNSLTAGYSDGSLTVSGQLNSYPERLFEQFQLVPGAKGGAKSYFVQPLLHSDNGYPSAKLVLGYAYDPCAGDSTFSPISYPNYVADPIDAQRYTWQNSTYNNGQINNMGVPGIRIADYPVPGYSASNPYSARFFKNVGPGNTPFDELNYRVLTMHASFFTMWLGANDVLGFATGGGIGVGSGAVPFAGNYYSTNDITPNNVFFTLYDSAVRVVTGTTAYGALINIPDVTSLPYFNLIPSNGFYISRQSQADSLNAFWAGSIPAKIFKLGYNQYVVQDHMNIVRQSTPGELILMTAPFNHSSCASMDSMGTYTPIPNQYVLTTEELQDIHNAVTSFNLFIYQESLKYRLAYVDMNQYLKTLMSGVVYNGISYNANYITGGAFSLDGIHLTQRGYALAANNIIATVDSYYHATVPLTDANKYNGILYP